MGDPADTAGTQSAIGPGGVGGPEHGSFGDRSRDRATSWARFDRPDAFRAKSSDAKRDLLDAIMDLEDGSAGLQAGHQRHLTTDRATIEWFSTSGRGHEPEPSKRQP